MASFASAPTVIAVGDRIPACEMHDGFPGVKGDAAKVMIDELCKGARDRSTRTRARAPRGSGSRAPSHTAALPLHPPPLSRTRTGKKVVIMGLPGAFTPC